MAVVGIVLREVVEADLETLFEHQRDPEANRMADFPARDRAAFHAHWKRVLASPSDIARAIVADGELAGNLVCFTLAGERLVGYWLGRSFWGRGIATRALAAFLAECDERPLLAHVARHNQGSIRVLEKCGFRRCGETPSGSAPAGQPENELRFRLDPAV